MREGRTKETQQKRTLSKCLRILRDQPVTRLDVGDLEQGEELADDGQRLVRHVLALRAPDEQRWPLEAHLPGLLEGEVAHVREGAAEDLDGDAEALRLLAFWRVEVAEEELPDGEGLLFCLVFVSLEVWTCIVGFDLAVYSDVL